MNRLLSRVAATIALPILGFGHALLAFAADLDTAHNRTKGSKDYR